MNASDNTKPRTTNGSGAAAMLSAAVGCFVLAAIAFAGDKSAAVKSSLIFYKPTGPLSGVTTAAVLAWLLTWVVLEWRWRVRTVAMGRIVLVSVGLLVLSLLLTFPPVVDLL